MTAAQREALAKIVPAERLRFNEPMSSHSTMGIGGPAEAFVTLDSLDEIKNVIRFADEEQLEYRVWGGGSDLLVKDGGLKGIVIKLGDSFDFINVERTVESDVFVRAGAAFSTWKLVNYISSEGLSGLEGLAGCFGTVGGNVMTNAGSKNGTIGDVVEELTILSRDGRELTLKKSALRFEYRGLKIPRTAAVVSALLKLKKATTDEVKTKVDEIIQKRDASQPKGTKSLGCIFKNPEKVAAGMLIDEAGLKGVRVGGARVSNVHANFIVNEGKATARDVLVLISLVRERVKESSGVILETEIGIIGED